MSEGIMTPLQEAAAALHEFYEALTTAGFDEEQAIYLITTMIESA